MRKRVFCLVCAALLLLGAAGSAFADDEPAGTAGQPASIPVYLTVARTVRSIDVTLPASLPVSVLDGVVVTANDLVIINNSATMRVAVSGVSVTAADGGYGVASYDAFPQGVPDVIALRINGCGTAVGGGALALADGAFPAIEPGAYLRLDYQARVASSGDVSGLAAANVVFTLRAERA